MSNLQSHPVVQGVIKVKAQLSLLAVVTEPEPDESCNARGEQPRTFNLHLLGQERRRKRSVAVNDRRHLGVRGGGSIPVSVTSREPGLIVLVGEVGKLRQRG
ncbi:hypothetical protein AAFF_G00387540 [Aldrovandia affinis]|uniref:Uncharacterized protein n=1 Tax=Aldrovandia affinis TaxID=143900 RepID=A0AAD7WLE0_9TELE|nr:hypothetical protein AAFF_G00387540 [Aldrovandia affinis]